MSELHITAAAAIGPLGASLDEIWENVMTGHVNAEELEVASGKSYVCSACYSGKYAHLRYGLP